MSLPTPCSVLDPIVEGHAQAGVIGRTLVETELLVATLTRAAPSHVWHGFCTLTAAHAYHGKPIERLLLTLDMRGWGVDQCLDLVVSARRTFPAARLTVLGHAIPEPSIAYMMQLGIQAVVCAETATLEDLVAAVLSIHRTDCELVRASAPADLSADDLTLTQCRLIAWLPELVTKRLTRKEVAVKLGLGYEAVSKGYQRLAQRFGASSERDLLDYCAKTGQLRIARARIELCPEQVRPARRALLRRGADVTSGVHVNGAGPVRTQTL